MRVAVTGARGFIGGHLVPYLRSRGHEVMPLGRSPDGRTMEPIERSEHSHSMAGGPLPSILAGTEAVVHLAARSVDPAANRFADYVEPNVVLTEDILDAAASVGASRFVLASSRLVYPGSIQGAARESDATWPETPYGLSKRVAEEVMRIKTEQERFSGIALRLSQAVGPGDRGRGVLNRFIAQARQGGPITVTGPGEAVRDLVDVSDVVRAFALAVEVATVPSVVNIGGQRGHSILDLARSVAVVAGLDPDRDIVHLPTQDDDRTRYELDIVRAAEALGWHPRQTLEAIVRLKLRDP